MPGEKRKTLPGFSFLVRLLELLIADVGSPSSFSGIQVLFPFCLDIFRHITGIHRQ